MWGLRQSGCSDAEYLLAVRGDMEGGIRLGGLEGIVTRTVSNVGRGVCRS